MRGRVMVELNRPDDAVASCEKAVALNPAFTQGALDNAAVHAADPLRRRSRDRRARADYERRLRALCDDYEAGRIPGDMSKGMGWAQPFFLAYQGRCDRDLQVLFGGLATRVMAARYGEAGARAAAGAGRADACRHRQRFLLPAFGLEGRRQGLGHAARPASASRCSATASASRGTAKPNSPGSIATVSCEGPHPLEQWREIIAADRPHILLYPEIGMFHQAAEIAALRLAPVQCSYIGHPQTSGYPTIDYFLSGDLIEPPDGDAPLFGKARPASQHRLPLRAAGARRPRW